MGDIPLDKSGECRCAFRPLVALLGRRDRFRWSPVRLIGLRFASVNVLETVVHLTGLASLSAVVPRNQGAFEEFPTYFEAPSRYAIQRCLDVYKAVRTWPPPSALRPRPTRGRVIKAALFRSLSLTRTGVLNQRRSAIYSMEQPRVRARPAFRNCPQHPDFRWGRRKCDVANARAICEGCGLTASKFSRRSARSRIIYRLAGTAGLTQTQVEAVKASLRAVEISRTQYKESEINCLDVIDSERTVLQTRRAAVQLRLLTLQAVRMTTKTRPLPMR